MSEQQTVRHDSRGLLVGRYRFLNLLGRRELRYGTLALRPGDAVAHKIVAVVGQVGDWAAYVGPTDWTDEQVADRGDKLSRATAEAFFPDLAARLTYRL